MVNILHMKTISQEALSAIRHKVEAAGYKMSDVCRVAEIDQAQVSRWMSGTTEPLYGRSCAWIRRLMRWCQLAS